MITEDEAIQNALDQEKKVLIRPLSGTIPEEKRR